VSFAKTRPLGLKRSAETLFGGDTDEHDCQVQVVRFSRYKLEASALALREAEPTYARVSGQAARRSLPVVQAADLRECDHVALGGSLHTSWRRRVFLER
jgi:hypothetical protein